MLQLCLIPQCVFLTKKDILLSNHNIITRIHVLLLLSPQAISNFAIVPMTSLIASRFSTESHVAITCYIFLRFLQSKTTLLFLTHITLTLLKIIGRRFSRMPLSLEHLVFLHDGQGCLGVASSQMTDGFNSRLCALHSHVQLTRPLQGGGTLKV